MEGHLLTLDGQSHDVAAATMKGFLDSSTKFWLDLAGLEESDAQSLLRDTFGFHPLAVEDAEHFGQRPKLDSYDGHALMVVYGATGAGALVEVHCFFADGYLVTVHHDPCPAITAVAERLRQRLDRGVDLVMVLYRLIDTLVDGYFPVLTDMDDEIDDLEDQILERPTEKQLGRIFDMKRSLIAMRKVVTPQRDMFAAFLGGRQPLPGMTPEAERYFRDIYDHLIRISDLVDSYRDLMSGALDTHLSTVSNRLNVVMKQLTIIATIFLPLSFLTGFFGQNFAWMVNRLNTLPVFLAVGVGLQVLAVAVLVALFKQRGWLSSDGTLPQTKPSARRPTARETRWRLLRLPGPDGTGPR